MPGAMDGATRRLKLPPHPHGHEAEFMESMNRNRLEMKCTCPTACIG